MAAWIGANGGTVLAALVLVGAVCLIVRGLLKDKKRGKSSCGCNCAHCPASGACHRINASKTGETR